MTREEIVNGFAPALSKGFVTQKQVSAYAVLFGTKNGNPADPDGTGTETKTVRGVGTLMQRLNKNSQPASVKGRAAQMINGARVKDASERLSRTKSVAKRPDGRTVNHNGKPVMEASDYEKAVIGVWFKHQMKCAGLPVEMSDWQKALLHETVTKGKWVGGVDGREYGGGADPSDFVPNTRVKALLDDTISGGLYLTPYEFDSNIITYPLLHSEILPLVDLQDVTARRIEGAKMNNMTLTWGMNPGSALTPFNTASLVSELYTPIWPIKGGIELSNDMLTDSPINIGAKVAELFGERLKAELDRVIVAGGGNYEPLGITNTSGLVNVNSDNGTSGPPTVSDYEALTFSVAKQYRQKEWNPAFLGNDTSYRRARGISVGPADERRVFGMDEQSYTLLDYPYKVQNDIANNRVIFGCWKKYRLYRRLGSQMVVERGGRQLTLSDVTLVVCKARFGGQPVDTNAFALMSDAQQ